ncbi:CCAAT/enhancer-binding protein gamma-like [Ambystoma mexicanum]|uniref:CCAAT/enhancer-binding protein gamma-like n=1 Tax=Ambystoma mexicanum TaxID=8296 RepID=UPI0037E765BE
MGLGDRNAEGYQGIEAKSKTERASCPLKAHFHRRTRLLNQSAVELAPMNKALPAHGTLEQNGLGTLHGAPGLAQQPPQLVPASPGGMGGGGCSSSSGGGGSGKATAPSKQGKKGGRMDRASKEYCQRRERNNMAVKKSRLKSKQKAQGTLQRVTQLKEVNERLEAKIKLLTKELSVLKDLFLEHAHNLADNVPPTSADDAPPSNPENAGQ